MKLLCLSLILPFLFCESQLNFKVFSRQDKKEILRLLQGKWRLYQNKKQELYIRGDTICYFYSSKSMGTYLIEVSDTILGKHFESNTPIKNNNKYYIKELSMNSKEVENQYVIISIDRKKFVLRSCLKTIQHNSYG